MDKVKKLIVSASTLALLAGPYGMAMPAFGSASCNNTSGDDHSYQECESHDDDSFTKTSSNAGVSALVVDFRLANNGNNNQDGNEDENEMVVDDADAESSTVGFVAVNETEFEAGGNSAESSNEDATDHSTQVSSSTDDDYAKVNNSNEGVDMFGLNVAVANNGFNSQSGNEDENQMTVKDADAYAESGLAIGSNYASINTGGSASSNNSVADDHSYQEAESHDDDSVIVSNKNAGVEGAAVVVAVANNGGNNQDGNEDENEMVVKDSSAEATSEMYLGVNETNVTTGGNSAEATNTGATDHSTQVSSSTDDDYAEVHNSNEDVSGSSVNVAVANGGLNSQSGNEDGNKMTIGKASASGKTTVVIGTNQTTVSE